MIEEKLYSSFQNVYIENVGNNNGQKKIDLQYNQVVNVSITEKSEMVAIEKEVIRKIKNECKKLKNICFPWSEILLSISSLLIGAFISALISQISYELKFLSVFFYTICPSFGLGLLVAYFLIKKNDIYTAKLFADRMEDYISNIEVEDRKNEY